MTRNSGITPYILSGPTINHHINCKLSFYSTYNFDIVLFLGKHTIVYDFSISLKLHIVNMQIKKKLFKVSTIHMYVYYHTRTI